MGQLHFVLLAFARHTRNQFPFRPFQTLETRTKSEKTFATFKIDISGASCPNRVILSKFMKIFHPRLSVPLLLAGAIFISSAAEGRADDTFISQFNDAG